MLDAQWLLQHLTILKNTVAQFIDAAQLVLHPDEPLHNCIETPAIETLNIVLIKGVECEIRLSGDDQINSV